MLSGFDTCYLYFLGQASAGKLCMRSIDTLIFYTFDLGHHFISGSPAAIAKVDIDLSKVRPQARTGQRLRDILQLINICGFSIVPQIWNAHSSTTGLAKNVIHCAAKSV